jgi:hypothetical protein
MDDQSMQALTTEIENELLQIIIDNLDQEKMTVEEAQKIAQEFLALLPLHDKRDLLDKLYKFGLGHAETKSLYIKYAKPVEEEERQKKLALMSEHIKNGQIDNALAIAKGETPHA